MGNKRITVGEEPYTGDDNEALQHAVDSLSYEGGGAVELPAGTYEMKDALYLRSGVHVLGSGRETRLVKRAGATVELAEVAGYGQYEVVVEDPEPLEPGMGVFITDDTTSGFETTTATILNRRGQSLYIDEMLNAEYDPSRGARVIALFPLVCGRYAENCSISNMNLHADVQDGQMMDGCRGGGVYLTRCHRIDLSGIEVSGYPGEAVSFQHCTDIAIEDSRFHENAGGGIRVGEGSVRHIIRNNNIHENGGDGITYGLRSTHSLCESNQIHRNKGAGISVGERSTHHMIRSNELQHNAGPGLQYRDARFHGGNSGVVHGNAFRHNCEEFGEADVVIGSGLRDLLFRRNFFYPERAAPPDQPMAEVGQGCARIYFFDNTLANQPLCPSHVHDEEGSTSCEEPARPAPPRPAPMPPATWAWTCPQAGGTT
ncbi:MAG: right-handed parallel beta-helix repeat-containing protein [Planctomycetota bacterium]